MRNLIITLLGLLTTWSVLTVGEAYRGVALLGKACATLGLLGTLLCLGCGNPPGEPDARPMTPDTGLCGHTAFPCCAPTDPNGVCYDVASAFCDEATDTCIRCGEPGEPCCIAVDANGVIKRSCHAGARCVAETCQTTTDAGGPDAS